MKPNEKGLYLVWLPGTKRCNSFFCKKEAIHVAKLHPGAVVRAMPRNYDLWDVTTFLACSEQVYPKISSYNGQKVGQDV